MKPISKPTGHKRKEKKERAYLRRGREKGDHRFESGGGTGSAVARSALATSRERVSLFKAIWGFNGSSGEEGTGFRIKKRLIILKGGK